MKIQVEGISKLFDRFPALHEVDVTVPSGKLVALLGPSGSGKTTLLRIIAGLEFADAGRVLFDGRDVSSLPAGKRQVGFVFQHYALFRHMNVFKNITFGLDVRPRSRRPSRPEVARRVTDLLRLVQLEGLENRYPSQLSGGQRQRIALARALAVEPKVLLLDEPFGALDAKVRKELRGWLREFHEKVHITSLFVTHDQEEALELADEIVVMHEGQVQQVGTPEEVYANPANEFVFGFLGNVNRVRSGSEGPRFVRPHDIVLTTTRSEHSVAAVVATVHAAGPLVRATIEADGQDQLLQVELSQREARGLGLREGQRIFAEF